MVVRGSSLEKGMSRYLVDQINDNEKIEVLTRTMVTAVHGEQGLASITMKDTQSNEEQTVPAAAMFVFIGAMPHTDMATQVVQCNRAGFVLTGADLLKDGRRPDGWTLRRDPYLLETSVPGIFAAGDVRQGAVRRVASAVGQGANVISFVHQYLRTV
jgi:thioredoxin reductase (NADPH)